MNWQAINVEKAGATFLSPSAHQIAGIGLHLLPFHGKKLPMEAEQTARPPSHLLVRAPRSRGSRRGMAACAILVTAFLGVWFYATGKACIDIFHSMNFSPIAAAVGLTFFAFGFAGLWLLWSLRLLVFPYQLVIDRQFMRIWHQWGGHRPHTSDISGCTAIVVAPAWSRHSWPYYITARCRERTVHILRSESSFGSETTALREGSRDARRIADFLNVLEEWSEGALAQLNRQLHPT